jgi:hypothetical protein
VAKYSRTTTTKETSVRMIAAGIGIKMFKYDNEKLDLNYSVHPCKHHTLWWAILLCILKETDS